MDQSSVQQSGGDTYPKITFDHFINKDKYMIGVAFVQPTGGTSPFEVRVSGQAGSLDAFQAEAVFKKLECVPVDDVHPAVAASQQAVLKARREYWKQRLEKLQAQVDKASLEQLSDPHYACDLEQAAKTQEEPPHTIDLTRDRLIEITPQVDLEKGRSFHVAFVMHPSVQKGCSDFYQTSDNRTHSASAFLSVIGGDPDLYLQRGGKLMDYSLTTGASESVWAQGGAGDWLLQVYGYDNSTYELSGDWYLE